MGTQTELGVKSAKEGMHGDGDGRMLVVHASGKKSWLLRYQMKASDVTWGLAYTLRSASRRPARGRSTPGG